MEATARPAGINRRLPIEVTPSLTKRFWLHVEKRGESDCWLWKGSQRNGYGAIKHQQKVHSAHKVSYAIHNGDIGEGLIVTHDCDNRICCNPAHLRAGTPKSNVTEMRQRIDMLVARGEGCPYATHTEDDVRLVRAKRLLTGWGARKLSKALPYSESWIGHVLHCGSWEHIPTPTREEAEAILAKLPAPESASK